jgi:hypothetical protein
VRNCRREPVKLEKLSGYMCKKRRKINNKLSNVLEIAMYCQDDYSDLIAIITNAGLVICETKRGLSVKPKGRD